MFMNEEINRLRDSINNRLKSTSESQVSSIESLLIEILDDLNRLIELDSPSNDWPRLFCRQTNRLMNYNDRLTGKFWFKLAKDIDYIIQKPNSDQGMNSTWNCFNKRMTYEKELVQRELQFKKNGKEEKSLTQLFAEHEKFFQEYLQKCISLHSKVQVQGLIDNLDGLFFNSYRLTEVTLPPKTLHRVKEKLKSIKIPVDCSNRSLQCIHSGLSKYTDLCRQVNTSAENIIPSTEQRRLPGFIARTVEELLESVRWLVILGDSATGKTSLLQWIMCMFAEAAYRGNEEVILKENKRIAVRIPIFIRIGEFALWLEQYQNGTLIDYIGQHTWFSDPYTSDNNASVWKELIYHGHALILLDGLDEIVDLERRGKIVEIVKKFIDEYVRAPDFISAFDDRILDMEMTLLYKYFQTQPPRKSGGNQIIITSRSIGYYIYRLNGPLIEEYALLSMRSEQAKEFVIKFMLEIQKSVTEVLLNEEIILNKETLEALSKKQDNVVQSMFKKSPTLFVSNLALLSVTGMFIFQFADEFHQKTNIEVYNHIVQSALNSWTIQEPSIPRNILVEFLINLSTYLHARSPSGLIDTFDMKQLCCLILKQQGVTNNRVELHEYANKLTALLDSNAVVKAEQDLQVFGFQHLTFQEYFVSQAFVKDSSIEETVNLILTYVINPRFRTSLLFAVGWISSKWLLDDYNKFCDLLINSTEDYAIPFGSLLFFDALSNTQRLPSRPVRFSALNKLLDHPFNFTAKTYLIPNLAKLNDDIIIEWMQLHLVNDSRLCKFC